MSQIIEKGCPTNQNRIWEVKGQLDNRQEKSHDIHGVLIFDVDGTLTRPGSMYAIDSEAIGVVTEFVDRGGFCVFNTGATLGRLERTVLNPIFNRLDEKYDSTKIVSDIFQNRIIAMPENGSAILLNTSVEIVENELYFLWNALHALHVPDKENLRTLIEKELIPKYRDSLVVGDHIGEMNPRQYILSWKGVSNTLDLVEEIKQNIIPQHPEINWGDIEMKAARKTIDFIHAKSGKQSSTNWLLHEISSLDGPVLGFGDLGDEFGKVVPTFNVNQNKPNEFRRRKVPAMEFTRWTVLPENMYVVIGSGKNTKVRNKNTDTEIQVLRDEEGEIVYAIMNEKGILEETTSTEGFPVEIKPAPVPFKDVKGESRTFQDAGKGTAQILRFLMDIGYFRIIK
jgi:hydroxymethylpyrimidine pyrophosphatase-like HAD family hydrolase